MRNFIEGAVNLDDWRIHGDEDFLNNTVLYEIKFPEFWKKAYQEKNAFFQLIKNDAENYVKTMGKGTEFLNGEKVQYFWHEHCFFVGRKRQLMPKRCFIVQKICKFGFAANVSMISKISFNGL